MQSVLATQEIEHGETRAAQQECSQRVLFFLHQKGLMETLGARNKGRHGSISALWLCSLYVLSVA